MSRSTRIRQDELGTDCIIMFDMRKKQCNKTYHEVLWCPDTYDFARGLSLGSHSSPLSAAVVAQSGGRVFPFFDPSASSDGSAFLFLSPPAGGENFPPPPRFHGRSARRSHRTMSPIQPCAGDPFGSPRPSSWPSLLAPCKVPESASSLEERLQDLRAGGLDNQVASLSLSSPVNDMEA